MSSGGLIKRNLPRVSEHLSDSYSRLQHRYVGPLQQRLLHPSEPKTSYSPWGALDMALPNVASAPASPNPFQLGVPTFKPAPPSLGMPMGQIIPRKEADPNYKAPVAEPSERPARPAPAPRPSIPANYRTFRRVEEVTSSDLAKKTQEKPEQPAPADTLHPQPPAAPAPRHFSPEKPQNEPGEKSSSPVSRAAPPSTVQREMSGPEVPPAPRPVFQPAPKSDQKIPAAHHPAKPEPQQFSAPEGQPAEPPSPERRETVRSYPPARPADGEAARPPLRPASRPEKGTVQREIEPQEPPVGKPKEPIPEPPAAQFSGRPSEQLPAIHPSEVPVEKKPAAHPGEEPTRIAARPAAPKPALTSTPKPIRKMEARPASVKTVQREMNVVQREMDASKPFSSARPAETPIQHNESSRLPETQQPTAAHEPTGQQPIEGILPEKKELSVLAPEKDRGVQPKAAPAPRLAFQRIAARPARPSRPASSPQSLVQREMAKAAPALSSMPPAPAERPAAPPSLPTKKKIHQPAPMRPLDDTRRMEAALQASHHGSHLKLHRPQVPAIPAPVFKKKPVFNVVQRELDSSPATPAAIPPRNKRNFNFAPPSPPDSQTPIGDSILRRVRARYNTASAPIPPPPPVISPTLPLPPLAAGEPAKKDGAQEKPPEMPAAVERSEQERPASFGKIEMPVVPAVQSSASPEEGSKPSAPATEAPQESSRGLPAAAGKAEGTVEPEEKKLDLDQIARQVYPVILRRLSVERERRSGRPW